MATGKQYWQRGYRRSSVLVAIASLCFVFSDLGRTTAQQFVAQASSIDQEADGFARTKEIHVEKTFNNDPFHIQLNQTSTERGYRIFRLTYPSPVVTDHEPNNIVPADYYLPNGIVPGSPARPAVICLHILNGNFELVNMLCTSLAQRGVPAIMFKLPYYGERSLPGGLRDLESGGRLFLEALPQGMLDARRTCDVLAALPQIDPERIGIAGISLGSFVSASTAGSDARFYRTALLLSGGDLLGIIHDGREARALSRNINALPLYQQQQFKQKIIAVDPLTHALGLRDRAVAGRVLMINADQDKVVPPAATKKLAKALGISDKVFWLEGLGHYTAAARLPEIMRHMVDFFAQDLPPGSQVPKIDANSTDDPIALLANLVAQSASMFTVPPAEGHCHLADIGIEVTEPGGKKHTGTLNLVRGTEHQFKIQLDAPVLGKAYFGQRTHPWMATDQMVFLGVPEGNVSTGNNVSPEKSESGDPLAFADSDYLRRVKLVTGMMAQLPLAPAVLEQLVRAETEFLDDGTLVLTVVPRKETDSNYVCIEFQQDQKTPKSISFDIDHFQGKLTIRSWQSDSLALPVLFQPPQDLPIEEVETTDLQRIFAALFNFAMEFTE